ncbi:methylenetetrahydrofolate reductase 2-like [Drosophila hydei]|uniref:Methylenetetrahydrofolate reductase 2-like n=1 Tax=Drosophila hydei TaxID=7224 RepID=A0A6J1M8W1_DROHY|nr:methylenetetrahydrofolate reductase 2-like [Drosophila hydei]
MCVNVTRNQTAAALLLRNVTTLAQNRVAQLIGRNQLLACSARVNIELAMHTLEPNGTRSFAGDLSKRLLDCFQFTPEQLAGRGEQPYISDLVSDKVARGEFFYGIEITAQSGGKLTCVDFNRFQPILPTLISIVWLCHYWDVTPMERVDSLQMIRHLEQYIPAMPHFSIYMMTKERIDEFLALNFKNLLAVRGNRWDDNQFYTYGYQLVEHARRARKSNLTIAIPGYPLCHVGSDRRSSDMLKNLEHLKQKIDNGADLIITQMCYSAELLVEYLRCVRNAGIVTPIMVGVVVPESLKSYKTIQAITSIELPAEKRAELRKVESDNAKVREYFVQLALGLIQKVLDAKLDVYGVQFYTMNRFGGVHEVLNRLQQMGILKETPQEACGDS